MGGEESFDVSSIFKSLTTAAFWIFQVVSAMELLATPNVLNMRSQSLLPLRESYYQPSIMSTFIHCATSQDLNLLLLHLCPLYGAC